MKASARGRWSRPARGLPEAGLSVRPLRGLLETGPSVRPLRGLLETGFTLIEIIVALAVLAMAMGAVISGMASHAGNAAYLREKTLALLVAHNRLTEIELEPAMPSIGKSDGDAEFASADWRWSVAVSETPDETVRRVEVRVRLAGREEDSATLTGFLSCSGRQC